MSIVISQQKKPFIRFDPQKCSFCKTCELACAKYHYGKYGASISRITIVRRGMKTLKYFICTRCEKKFCINACPKKALSYINGNIVVNEELCDSCGKCVEACPFHGIKLHPETKKPIICDTCNGEFQCIKSCPKNALTLVWLSG
ncbi:MAG: 4Fe-4S dicluster domain-containing protein [Candidatus Methanomethylicia archaeon]|jgi:Fe-S-cluster-containing hydrogenase component 2|uniref:4Fe-4S dicluster domain-containing protein n=1 Tax=Thermoproteota archaeon TaxID=2056631 RepID=A0A520KFK6_9CREN|nr:4Fe-4S dicluster domain-containing protein [Candidatus Methanomethylicia archaeon]MCQ5341181.1 4Fe-4S dicluster domain-containing protein [Candidatus Methanomethylicia archaeon]NHV45985.1 4Fe-4S dicluster domain-containing protein [Candidatus Verstraetearchaeota archaeon]RZN56230.1 MAG: 4Fe-4S dicluster domain-containing protein [Candidatus Verstraetearchaeota archaeon]TDA37775.1 MAG: 4Fe-4S dicluster domain-containing protein [Candidatus Verstraetearchaeota archaeon]